MGHQYVYGPVPSRRLGRSLGVDLVPAKTCNFDCIYCQLGPCAETTVERAEYAPIDEVLAQIEERLAAGPRPDWITLGGSGDPTLNASLGVLAERLHSVTDVPVCMLTNGGLFWREDVRADCAALDMIAPNLDAADEETFRAINRPHAGITLERVVAGLELLRREFSGQIWLEVFLALGLNTSDADIARLRPLIDRIAPDKVQLNTAVRPTAEANVRPVPIERLEEIRAMLGERAEVIVNPDALRAVTLKASSAEDVHEMLRRRPCTVEDVATGLGIGRGEAKTYVLALLRAERIGEETRGDKVFYRAGGTDA